jgi:hypothetical protein
MTAGPAPASPALQPETDAPGFAAALPLLLTILGADGAAVKETSP